MAGAPLTFIIPVRHQANAKNWDSLKKNLAQTVKSIAAQTSDNWSAIVVANDGADLPELPHGFAVTRVDYSPNILHDIDSADRESVYQAFRLDKGRRVLAGLIAQKPQGHVMIVDDDDFVSRWLAGFVASNPGHSGWSIDRGYIWADGGHLLYRHNKFSSICGTSHIIRADLYHIPARAETASVEYIQNTLGSHIFIEPYLRAAGTPLGQLPFSGAVYRVGHAGAHSKSKGLIGTFIKPAARQGLLPLIRSCVGLRWLSPQLRRNFSLP